MWPAERDVLRVGRERIERWACGRHGMVLRGQQALPMAGALDVGAMQASMISLLREGQEPREAKQRARGVDVVLESAWLPVMLLVPGASLWSGRQVEAFLKHRVSQLYGDGGEQANAWTLQLDHRAGDANALGYALSSPVEGAVLAATATAQVRIASLQPAFAWGRTRLQREQARLRSGWWVWIEQDRSLLCALSRGRPVALNAGAPVPLDASQCRRLIEIESVRQGIDDAAAPVFVAGWDVASPALATQHDGLSWVSLAGAAA